MGFSLMCALIVTPAAEPSAHSRDELRLQHEQQQGISLCAFQPEAPTTRSQQASRMPGLEIEALL